jgi:cellulose biosynthesis protein BcsQ
MSPAEVICLASAKGGSGKTLLAATFGTVLASLGKRVLLIDTDASTNGLSLLHLREVVECRDAVPGSLGLFESTHDSTSAFEYAKISDDLYILPATFQFSNTEDTDVGLFAIRLRGILGDVRDSFDFILIDAQAGSDEYAQIAMSSGISDKVVIVSEYDPVSAAGVERLKAILGKDLGYTRTWILLNKVLPEFAKNFSDFLEIARYLNPIPWDADVVRAYARRRLAVDLVKGNSHTLAVLQALRTLLPGIEAELDAWLTARSSFLRDSIDRQIAIAGSTLDDIRSRQLEQLSLSRTRRYLKLFLPPLFLAATLIGVSTVTLHSETSLQLLVVLAGGAAAALAITISFVMARQPTLDESAHERAERTLLERRLEQLLTLKDLEPNQLVERGRDID